MAAADVVLCMLHPRCARALSRHLECETAAAAAAATIFREQIGLIGLVGSSCLPGALLLSCMWSN